MLVSFAVRNFKSFSTGAVLEMAPGKSRSKANHIRNDCLMVASIYGANASGKSNLIQGIKTMKMIVSDPFFHGNEPLYSWDSKDHITEFEMIFNIKGFQYRYELEVESVGINLDRPSKSIFIYPLRRERLYVTNLKYEPDKNGNVVEDLVLNREVKPSVGETGLLKSYEEYNRLYSKLQSYNIKSTSVRGFGSLSIASRAKLKSLFSESKVECLFDEILLEESLERKHLNSKRYEVRSSIRRYKMILQYLVSKLDAYPSTIMTSLKTNQRKRSDEVSQKHLLNVLDWFHSGLIVLDTHDVYIPESKDNLDSVSSILNRMDLGIDGIKWKQIDKVRKLKVIDELSIRDQIRLDETLISSRFEPGDVPLTLKTKSGLYRFIFNRGESNAYELVPVKSDDKQFQLYSESDGTVRVIELASILTKTEHEQTFVVDELDRRLHPMLTRKFIELYLADSSSSKQLIFTTHETEILTTDLFRKDEIWFVEKRNGESFIESLDNIYDINFNKRLERLYLEDKTLPGIPDTTRY